jgi:hypothetical protein
MPIASLGSAADVRLIAPYLYEPEDSIVWSVRPVLSLHSPVKILDFPRKLAVTSALTTIAGHY